MKPYLLPVLLLLALGGLPAQRIVPLQEHVQLRPAHREVVSFRAECGNPDLPGIERILTSGQRTVRIDLDTVGLGSDLTDYGCIGCATARFGTVTLTADTILYTPFPDVEQGLDTLNLFVCSPGGVCSDTVPLILLVQRPGRTVELGNQLILPGTRVRVNVPGDSLPGGAVCRTIAACGDDYGGRSQETAFLFRFGEGNSYVYDAAGYGGTDAVCLTVCNAFGLCDTYRSTFTVDRPAVSLPFFDDFSYDSIRPDLSLWQDNDVLINRNYAQLPPSIGVATFDAVNYAGQAYPADGNGRSGVPRDYLTSVPIQLAGQTGTVLSFYLQPKGLGNRPEVQDSFLVQFLDPAGNWNTVYAREGRLNTEPNSFIPPFAGQLVPVPAPYQYDGFQFRFLNLSTERGAVDSWHLDYVKLSNTSTSLITQDLALIEAPFRLLSTYTSMPIRHLQAGSDSLLADTIFLKLWNHRADITPVTQSTYIVRNLGSPPFQFGGGLFPSAFFGQDNGIAADTFEIRRATFDQLPTYPQIRGFLNGLDPDRTFTVATTYDLTVATEDAAFSPAIARNNRATQLTVFGDYFAYDDGSAEVAIEGQAGNVIVQRYTAYVADQLTGIRIRLPRVLGTPSDQSINFVVYGAGEDGRPGEELYSFEAPILYAEDYYTDSLQAFSSYALEAPVDLPAGDFFVGWRQSAAARVLPVGFDRNNQPENVQFFEAGSGWQPLSGATRGAIMIRPLLAGADIRPTATRNGPSTEPFVRVFPNPTTGVVNIRGPETLLPKDFRYTLYSSTGQRLATGKQAEPLDLGDYAPGVYLLVCRSGDRRSQHKIVRQ